MKEVVVVGDLLFIATRLSLTIYSVADPRDPVELGRMTFVDNLNDVVVAGDRALAAGVRAHLLDVSDPAEPRLLGVSGSPGAADAALILAEHTKPTIHDPGGRRVATLLDGTALQGSHHRLWRGVNDDGLPLASGVYLARLESGGRITTGKLAWRR